MSVTAEPDVTTDDDAVEVLPWWQNPWNLVAIAVAMLVLGGAIGWWAGHGSASPSPNDTDIGFLQDMRVHHEQAVQMSLIYLDRSAALPIDERDALLTLIANEIVFAQQLEVGRMIQLLRQFGAAEANDTGQAMAWMDEPTPIDRMPGLASEEELDALRDAAPGADLDRIYMTLMIAHHEGGIHMAEHASEHAAESEVRDLAAGMMQGQQSEVAEMQRLLSELGA